MIFKYSSVHLHKVANFNEMIAKKGKYLLCKESCKRIVRQILFSASSNTFEKFFNKSCTCHKFLSIL